MLVVYYNKYHYNVLYNLYCMHDYVCLHMVLIYAHKNVIFLTLCMPNTHMCMGVVKKEQEKKMFHSWDQTHNYRIGRLVSYPLGHQGSWVLHERLCNYSFINRVNYDTQIKHSACKGLMNKARIHIMSSDG